MDTSHFAFLLAFAVVALVCYGALRSNQLRRRRSRDPALPTPAAGPKGLPIIGNLIVVQRDYQKLAQYGKIFGGVFALRLFGVRFIVLSDWKTMKEALVEQAEIFSGRSALHVMKQVTQFNDISMSYGPGWKERKAKVLRLLHSFGFGKPSMENVIVDEISKLFEILDRQNKKAVVINECFFMPVLNVIWGIVAGTTYHYDDYKMNAMKQRIQLHLSLLTATMPVNAVPWLRFLPTDPFCYHRLVRNVQQMKQYLKSVIEEHQKTFNRQSEPRDFIDSYLTEMMPSPDNTTNEQRRIHTTKSTLEYGLMYVAHWPRVQDAVQAELDTIIGRGRMPTYADLSQLPYTNATILETHRYASVLPLSVPHRVMQTTILGGHTIEKDTLVFPNLWAVHHDESLWGDPQVFRPERFLNADGKVQKPEYFIPFGLGNRTCIGSALTRIELFLFFASLLQRYSFKNVSDMEIPSLDPVSKRPLTLVPQKCHLIVTER